MRRPAFAAAVLLALAAPAQADVVVQSEAGFVVSGEAHSGGSSGEVWQVLIAPAKWWSADHTYSHDAANLYLDAQATGCFCEKLPVPADAPTGQRMGSVEHMHVVYADPAKGILRMRGALGPLQGEALDGTLTITLNPADGGTQIAYAYVVGGFARMKAEDIAPMVDKVLGEQIASLGARAVPTDAAGSAK